MTESKFEQVKIICAEDCGNAPKKLLIKEFITAIACNDHHYVAENLDSDIAWCIVGDKVIQGIDEFLAHFKPHHQVIEVHIDNIITHGNTCAANGTVKYENSSISFCHIYRFSGFKNVKIKEITSYHIE